MKFVMKVAKRVLRIISNLCTLALGVGVLGIAIVFLALGESLAGFGVGLPGVFDNMVIPMMVLIGLTGGLLLPIVQWLLVQMGESPWIWGDHREE